MSQIRWTYVDDYGRKYKVGLYHGDRSGHVLIHCNAKIVVIDFHVRATKKYTFYINDELFDVHVEHKKGKFAYSFEIDERTRTPRNIKRWQRDRSDVVKTVAWAVGILAFISMTIYFIR